MIKWAEVTNVSPFKVKFFGEELESPRVYKRQSSYTPLKGDVVAFVIISGQYLCLGKFV